ncbi:ATP-dependent DNA ligase [Methanococcoides alaskense]|uniref:DNA ligase n=1 Tax=Methanococcoides alaskense TaxID=325778 RepID=A0AA90TX76_9EURY|nr:ATP-dependent DNA ligase [Methanococcoides alaskense]MDA0525329.1 ATP-dependent DNA ligase [Methanococcoides alaskense]MDR6221745.1 DNA ligase-1 [Methanococcoides alaskense]
MTDFKEFADVCKQIEHISSSLEMTDVVSDMLKSVSTEELPVVTHFVMGDVFPAWSVEQLGVGTSLLYGALSRSSGLSLKDIEDLVRSTGDIGETAVAALGKQKKNQSTFSAFMGEDPSISIMDVFDRFLDISRSSGAGSQSNKMRNLQFLFNSSSSEEARYLARLAIEDLRIGVGEGIVRDAISKAFDVPAGEIERGFMVTNDLGLVAVAAKEGGIEEISKLRMELDRPIKMMLAQVTPSIEAAIKDLGMLAIEWKFDGARVQIHKNGESVNIFSRRLENVTLSLPDIVEAVKLHVKADSAILEGEAVAVDETGAPRAFQDILKRFRRKYDVEAMVREIPLTLNLFDILYLNGEVLMDQSLLRRREQLVSCVDNCESIKVDEQVLTDDEKVVNEIYAAALKGGHEGVMLKNPEASYSPGKRGKNWLKKKPIMETLDLVVIGAEWGYGKRANLIGSYALACHDPEDGTFLPIGKVATGFSDEQLVELTEVFSELIVGESGREIELKPDVVFEIAFEEIQKSTNYGSGYALRFPRLVNVREDKSPEEAETIDRIESIYLSQRG